MSNESNFNNKEYWDERAEKLFDNIERNEKQLNKKLAEYYKVEAERLNKMIAEYYTKYGKDNVIQYRDLLKKLSDGERKLLIEDIDKFIEKYPKYKNLKKVRESIYKLDRLEGLKVSINLSQMELAEKEVEEVKKYLEDVYKTGFDYAYKELGYSTNFNSIDKDVVEKFINKSWVGGMNFSQRIYKNRDKVSRWVMTEFADGVKRGESYDRLVKKMMNKFQEVSKSSAKRLVATEASYMLNESSMSVFAKEFDEYKYNAILDSKTSKLCRKLDGEVYKIIERQAGKNFPPMHPNCRSSFTIVIPDDWMYNKTIESKLKNTQKEIKMVGKNLRYKPKAPDYSDFTFDNEHINSERKHKVTKEEAMKFIKNADYSIEKHNGRYKNYYSKEGAVFVDIIEKNIRTSFKKDEFDPKTRKMMEVLENERKQD